MSLEKLEKFHKQVKKLKRHPDFFKSLNFSFNYDCQKGLKIDNGLIVENTIKAFLVDFRPFWMNDSEYNFGRVCNLIFKNINDENIKDNIKKSREVWNKILEKKGKDIPFNGILLKINNDILSSSENLNRWLNEEHFHPDKEKGLKAIKTDPVFEGISRMCFIDQLQKMAKIIFWFDKEVISQILKDNYDSDLTI